jgi:hypothetical protein
MFGMNTSSHLRKHTGRGGWPRVTRFRALDVLLQLRAGAGPQQNRDDRQ